MINKNVLRDELAQHPFNDDERGVDAHFHLDKLKTYMSNRLSISGPIWII